MADNTQRTEMANQVLDLLLDDFLRILKEGNLSPTDRATIARFLKDNNYSVDEKKVPKPLEQLVADAKARRNLGTIPEVE